MAKFEEEKAKELIEKIKGKKDEKSIERLAEIIAEKRRKLSPGEELLKKTPTSEKDIIRLKEHGTDKFKTDSLLGKFPESTEHYDTRWIGKGSTEHIDDQEIVKRLKQSPAEKAKLQRYAERDFDPDTKKTVRQISGEEHIDKQYDRQLKKAALEDLSPAEMKLKMQDINAERAARKTAFRAAQKGAKTVLKKGLKALPIVGPLAVGLATGDASAAVPILSEADELGPAKGSLEHRIEDPSLSREERIAAIKELRKQWMGR